ncbi:hypothetical protein [Halomonas mongoliensis]|uniref:hypothetical protein n=1 Tax=Halomonas mongoliensis TaxID=321265 RepID=UPI00403B0669
MALMLVLLMIVSASQAHAQPWALPGPADHQTQADRALAVDATPSERHHAAPTEHPHCHHEHAWRPTAGVLPRSEAPDATPDSPALIASLAGPSVHQTAALGRALPGLTSRPAVPLYLLTQRFRS